MCIVPMNWTPIISTVLEYFQPHLTWYFLSNLFIWCQSGWALWKWLKDLIGEAKLPNYHNRQQLLIPLKEAQRSSKLTCLKVPTTLRSVQRNWWMRIVLITCTVSSWRPGLVVRGVTCKGRGPGSFPTQTKCFSSLLGQAGGNKMELRGLVYPNRLKKLLFLAMPSRGKTSVSAIPMGANK